MITIEKQKQPGSLIAFKKNGGTDYLSLDKDTKKDIVDSLLEEQGYLCAYCMRRIPRHEKNGENGYLDDHVRIEHLKDRAHNPELQLEYKNMVAVCPGFLGSIPHCDRSKGSRSITLSPFDSELEKSIPYATKDGGIKSENPDWNKDLTDEDLLNLNHEGLKIARKNVIFEVIAILGKKGWTKIKLERELDNWNHRDSNGYLREYAGVVRYFIKRKLRIIK